MVAVAPRGPQDQERGEARGEGVVRGDARSDRDAIFASKRREERDVSADVERRYYCVERGRVEGVGGPRG